MDPEGESDRVAREKAFNSTADCEDEAGRVRGLREHSVPWTSKSKETGVSDVRD